MEYQEIEEKKDQSIIEHMLSFVLDNEQFSIPVARVIEIIEVPQVSSVPRSPIYMNGVINVRGHVIPLIDTRVKLGMQAMELSVDTCVVIVEIQRGGQTVYVGILVDEVLEVLDVAMDAVQPAPDMGPGGEEECITGMFSQDNRFVMILDLDQIFSNQEIKALEGVSQSKKDN